MRLAECDKVLLFTYKYKIKNSSRISGVTCVHRLAHPREGVFVPALLCQCIGTNLYARCQLLFTTKSLVQKIPRTII